MGDDGLTHFAPWKGLPEGGSSYLPFIHKGQEDVGPNTVIGLIRCGGGKGRAGWLVMLSVGCWLAGMCETPCQVGTKAHGS